MLVTRFRRLDLAEDALSEAFARAHDRWPHDGVPANPAGWLYTTASRLMVGRMRGEAIHGRAIRRLAVAPDWSQPAASGDLGDLDDERLAMMLLCCHPALHPDARAALALRLVVGTRTDDIARLFLVPTSTMAARITRAKRKIVDAGIPLSSPADEVRRSRVADVCRAIYLAFTAGYSPGSGPTLLRTDVAADAVELARALHEVSPDDPQTSALLSLLVLQHARRDARASNGRLVTLPEQDRSRWHLDEIEAGLALLNQLPPSDGYAEELRLQSLIAAEHAGAPTAADTDWAAIAGHYASLESVTGSPVVRLNRAVAVAEAQGAAAGLTLLDGLDVALGSGHRLHAVRGELAARAGERDNARRSFRSAIERCENDIERAHLQQRLEEIEASG